MLHRVLMWCYYLFYFIIKKLKHFLQAAILTDVHMRFNNIYKALALHMKFRSVWWCEGVSD